MKPIIMSTDDVHGILDGRKTMMRRVIKPQPAIKANGKPLDGYSDSMIKAAGDFPNSKYKPGDALWVRETWTCMRDVDTSEESYFFAATQLDRDTIETTYLCDDDGFETGRHFPWKPSIFMPKKIARLFLRVTYVRVERVQDISTSDCESEGIASDIDRFNGLMTPHHDWIVGEFARIWDARNAKRGYGWDSNPWVWVYTFERITKEEGEHGH